MTKFWTVFGTDSSYNSKCRVPSCRGCLPCCWRVRKAFFIVVLRCCCAYFIYFFIFKFGARRAARYLFDEDLARGRGGLTAPSRVTTTQHTCLAKWHGRRIMISVIKLVAIVFEQSASKKLSWSGLDWVSWLTRFVVCSLDQDFPQLHG